MRTLSRPMFNMGGPIKQGIMHGIREPYAGGQLVRPGPGRPGYAGEDFWTKLAAQYNPKNFASPKKFLQRINPFSTKKLKAATNVPKVAPLIKKWHGMLTPKTPPPGIPGSAAGSAWMAGPSKYLGHLKKIGPTAKNIWDKHRYKTIAGGIGLTSDPARETYKWIGEKAPGIIKHVTPGWLERMISGEGKETGTATNVPLSPNLQKTIAEKPSAVDQLLAGAGKDNEKYALAERNKRVQKYLDLMGYDRAKKTAIGDALIDASKIVGDRGTLDLKNIGRELINPIIQATSKRLDKPGQIREAVGLMMTKAGLEKEMYDAKPGTILKNVQDMIKSGIPKDEAWAIATKGSKGVVSDLQAALATGKMSSTDWPAFVRATGAEHGEEVTVITAQDIKDNPDKYKNFKDKDVMEILAGEDDGIYIIAGETVRIKGGKATQIK